MPVLNVMRIIPTFMTARTTFCFIVTKERGMPPTAAKMFAHREDARHPPARANAEKKNIATRVRIRASLINARIIHSPLVQKTAPLRCCA